MLEQYVQDLIEIQTPAWPRRRRRRQPGDENKMTSGFLYIRDVAPPLPEVK